MEIGAVTPATISQAKQQEASQEGQVKVLKKGLDQQSEIASTLIEGIKQNPTPGKPGVGGKLDIVG